MQMKRFFTFLLVLAWAVSASGAILTFHPTQPAVDADDIYNLVGSAADRDNVGTSTADGAANDGCTYIAHDRNGKGQTFKTLNAPGSYRVRSVTVRHVGYTNNTVATWYMIGTESPLLVRLTDPTNQNTPNFVLASESYITTGSEDNIFSVGVTSSSLNGTGTWLTFTFENPILLASDTLYGFDITKTAGGQNLFFETHGIKDTAVGGNPYPNGTAYSTGTIQVPGNNLTVDPGDRVFIVKLDTVYSAWGPMPSHKAAGVDTDVPLTLSWKTGMNPSNPAQVNPNVKVHYLFGNFANPADPNLYLVAAVDAGQPVQETASYLLQGAYAVRRDQAYRWMIAEGLDNGHGGVFGPSDPNNISSAVWSFKTELSVPDIAPDTPADQVIFPGEPASFEVSALNPFTGDASNLTYRWYKNNVLLSSQTSSTLSIANAKESDEGEYYCVVTLTTNGTSSQSRTAILKLKKLVAHWKFDNDALDSADGFHGTLMGGPSFDSTGKIGQSLILDGVDDYVDIPDGFADFRSGLTISLWARPTAANNYARFLDFGNGAPSDNFFFTRVGTTSTLQYQVMHMNVSGGIVEAANALTLNEWQMLVVVHDPVTTLATLYKNGVPIASGGVAVPNNIVRTSNFIGRSNWTADAYYAGRIDDVRIYNYPLSEEEIAALYAAAEGPYCRFRPEFDLTGDCYVKLDDFAVLAQHWLECGFYPSCQ
ncbi:MAG TPA: immunoglobulin domain-containing protein [Anaerohalosphaeraceae bacterium]|nr:immunoglobulin domain-containing protein [Anaerohalosphaeraceae bacterium]